MPREIIIQSPFIKEDPNCEVPGDCTGTGFCERAFSTKISIEKELHSPGKSDLPQELTMGTCQHAQAKEMSAVGSQVLRQTRGTIP